MIRTTVASLVVATTLVLGADPAAAKSKKARDCAILAEIAQHVADQRTAGVKKAAAVTTVAQIYTGTQARFQKAVPPLADWLYSVPAEQTKGDVKTAYETACLAG